MVPRSSGIVLMTVQAYLEPQGPEGWRRVLERLPPAVAAELDLPSVTSQHWFPTTSLFAALHAVGELYGPPDFHERYGEFAADFAMTRLNRFIARFTSPIWVVSRATSIWSKFHDHGRWTIDEATPDHLRGTLHEFAVVDPGYCQVLTGWIRRMGQITGAQKNLVKHDRCRANGADACTWDGYWLGA